MTTSHVPSRSSVVALSAALVMTTFVAIVVNYLIYTVRWEFADLNPAYMAVQPPTISRAISEPVVGDPFAIWMLICAPVLFVGLCLNYLTYLFALIRHGQASRSKIALLSGLTALVLIFQAMASSGMVALSQYRFPNNGELHMAGSYLFFFSQAFQTFSSGLLSRVYGGLPEPGRILSVRMCRLRGRLIWIPVVLSVFYLGLFVVKGFDFGALSGAVYQTYVTTELFLISSFLIFMMTWAPDTIIAVRRYLRA